MNWHSVSEFLAMGGYARYVWGSFGMCALAMGVELVLLRQRQHTARARVRHIALADQMDKDTP